MFCSRLEKEPLTEHSAWAFEKFHALSFWHIKPVRDAGIYWDQRRKKTVKEMAEIVPRRATGVSEDDLNLQAWRAHDCWSKLPFCEQ